MLIKAKDIPNSIGLAGNISVSGKIIRVFDRKSGESDKGKWAFQNIIVQDDTGEFTVCLKNRDEEMKSTDVDRLATFNSSETKNGIMGVKIEKDTYKDKDNQEKTSIKVIVTRSAKIDFDSEVVKEASKTTEEEVEVEPAVELDLDQLRKDTIKTTLDAWKDAIGLNDIPIDNPKYYEILNSVILACGRNADTLFIAKKGGK